MAELSEYDYDLPRELIAQDPAPQRTDARLMVLNRAKDSIEHRHIRDLPSLLSSGDSLILNDTRVIPARLVGRRTATGGRWEGLVLECEEGNLWKVLCKTRGKIKPGESVTIIDRDGRVNIDLILIDRSNEGEWIVRAKSSLPALELLERIGRVPLPHYIRRGEAYLSDTQRYQTVFARHNGSVAAPTAGLHFTDELIRKLEDCDIACHFVTLHVGLDTFRPITTSVIEQHEMHSEWGRVDEAVATDINRRRTAGGSVIAVGSTSMRLLETVAVPGNSTPTLIADPSTGPPRITLLMTNASPPLKRNP